MRLLCFLFFLSGAAALIYEVVWFSLLRLVIGGSALSLGFLLAGYMGGLCIGSALYGRWKSGALAPIRRYAVLELGIGLFGMLIPLVMPWITQLYFASEGLLMLRATIGATNSINGGNPSCGGASPGKPDSQKRQDRFIVHI